MPPALNCGITTIYGAGPVRCDIESIACSTFLPVTGSNGISGYRHRPRRTKTLGMLPSLTRREVYPLINGQGHRISPPA